MRRDGIMHRSECKVQVVRVIERNVAEELKRRALERNAELPADTEYDEKLEQILIDLARLISIEEYNAFQDELTADYERRNWKKSHYIPPSFSSSADLDEKIPNNSR
jgi:hypothetical protein